MIVPVNGFGKGHPGAGSDRAAGITIKIKVKIKSPKAPEKTGALRNGSVTAASGSVLTFFANTGKMQD